MAAQHQKIQDAQDRSAEAEEKEEAAAVVLAKKQEKAALLNSKLRAERNAAGTLLINSAESEAAQERFGKSKAKASKCRQKQTLGENCRK